MSARGGTPQNVTRLDTSRGENAHYWPLVLPGGQKLTSCAASPREQRIYAAAIDGGNPVRIVSSLSSAIYAPPFNGRPGYLLWVQNNDLLAQPFDAERVVLSGQPATIASGVRVLEAQRGLMAAVSRAGVIAWASPRATATRLTWVRARRTPSRRVADRHPEVVQPRISPDGRRPRLRGRRMAWATSMCDFAVRKSRRVSPSPDYDEQPLWSSDSSELIYRGNDQGMRTMMRVRVDGGAPPVELMREKNSLFSPMAWSPDRRHILISNTAAAWA